MHVLIVGGGAVGSLLGALLAGAGHAVTLVRPEEPAADAVSLTLIRHDGGGREAILRLVPHALLAPEPDLIVLATKMFHLEAALEDCAEWPATPVMTIQNGVGAEETVAARRPAAPRVSASLTAAASLRSAREVAWMSRGGIALAGDGAAERLARRLARHFEAQGLRSKVVTDAVAMKWSKLLANLAGNALPAILGLDASATYGDARLFRVEREQILEALRVLRALGRSPIALPGAPVPLLALGYRVPAWFGRPLLRRAVAGGRGGKRPSLRIAVERGESPTEVRWMNGAVAREGDACGVPAPVNRRLAELVDEAAADPGRRAYFEGRPDRLLGELPQF